MESTLANSGHCGMEMARFMISQDNLDVVDLEVPFDRAIPPHGSKTVLVPVLIRLGPPSESDSMHVVRVWLDRDRPYPETVIGLLAWQLAGRRCVVGCFDVPAHAPSYCQMEFGIGDALEIWTSSWITRCPMLGDGGLFASFDDRRATPGQVGYPSGRDCGSFKLPRVSETVQS